MSYVEIIAVRFLQSLIRIYQRTLSLDHGPAKSLFPFGYCRFHPTCSEYALQALERKGLIKGLWFSLRRLLRCHPWSAGGVDEVK
jgi:putative membrane protein insertion efficiency factor